ncbi:hypothetical protein ACMC9I_02340 [Deinococcota bacterium DY0809b]
MSGRGRPWVALLLAALLAHPRPVPAQGGPWMGFFPSPARIEWSSLLATLRGIGRHADAVLLQRNVPWEAFAQDPDAPSRRFADLVNLVRLSREQGLEPIFVVDALNGLDRRTFQGVPAAWGKPSFADPRIRRAFKNFALRIVRTFQPRFLGLGSEVNTYMAAHPEDAPHLVSLYRETYAAVKRASPATRVFTTFQWDELRAAPGGPDWHLIEAFEPRLDLWVISSYPCLWLGGRPPGSGYYAPLALRTDRPLAVAEGGCASRDSSRRPASEQNPSDYLNAIADQLGPRLAFWIYLLYNDLDLESYREAIGRERDLQTLELFARMGLADADGRPKPALDTWDRIRRKLRERR